MKPQTEHLRAKMRVGAKELRQHESIFFHPDCTVGTGITPVHAFRLAGFTAGGESHPALKMLGLSGANCCASEAACQVSAGQSRISSLLQFISADGSFLPAMRFPLRKGADEAFCGLPRDTVPASAVLHASEIRTGRR